MPASPEIRLWRLSDWQGIILPWFSVCSGCWLPSTSHWRFAPRCESLLPPQLKRAKGLDRPCSFSRSAKIKTIENDYVFLPAPGRRDLFREHLDAGAVGGVT